MYPKVLIQILPWILLASLNFSDAFIIHYTDEHLNETHLVDQEGFISCSCNGHNKTEKMSINSIETVFHGIQNHDFCTSNKTTKLCEMLMECSNCTAEAQKCTPSANSTKLYDCSRKRIEKRDRFFININSSTGSPPELRGNRQESTCIFPGSAKTFDVVCKKNLKLTTCEQKCIYGYTLKGGITKQMFCEHSENVWKPSGFEECLPFIDCTVSLRHPGNVICKSGTSKMAASCNVSCEKYNDKPKIPERTYECQIDGQWKPKLPFCVVSKPGGHLVPAPTIKTHSKGDASESKRKEMSIPVSNPEM